jgi:hypothetical protein
VGNDVDGKAVDELFGQSIALSADGLILAAGAPGRDTTAATNGLARVYARSGASSTTWVQMGADFAAGNANDNAGKPVAISADGLRVAVGSHKADSSGLLDVGHVRVFEYDGSDWQQLGQTIEGQGAEDYFGFAVAISADGMRIAAGARQNDDGGSNAGQVRLFDWDGANWAQIGDAIVGNAEDRLGQSVALSADGSRVASGAYFATVGGLQTGLVRAYDITACGPTQQPTAEPTFEPSAQPTFDPTAKPTTP